MYRLTRYLLTRFAPRLGWPLALLVLAAACPALAAAGSSLAVPVGPILWAGVVSALLGLRAGRAAGWARPALGAAALLAGALFVAAGGRALPPASLVLGDLWGAAAAAARWWNGEAAAVPEPLAWRFLGAALPRFWGELLAAPGAGEGGAALLVTTVAVVTTWAGALCLAWAAGAGRPTFGWSLPLVVALGSTTILGGGDGAALVIGLALLLLLAVATGYRASERAWERAGAAYAEDLRWEALGWGGLAGALALTVALALPTSVPSALAGLLWPAGELPSGLAAIDSRVQRGPERPAAEVGLSQLPTIALGVSLEQGPPETLALRIRTGAPVAPGPWPRYWRARVLTRYDGRSWWAAARAGPFSPAASLDTPPPGAVLQEIEDLRRQRELLAALPDVIWLDLPASAERLPDGAIAALTTRRAAGRYTALSLPQELAAPPDESRVPPPDRSAELAVPPGVPPRVAELAAAIVGREASPIARAVALEAYLRQLPYSYTVRPLPRDGDAVDQFLFEMREGYCTYYASAMALMARSLGIPARVAVGYATGAYDQASGVYSVREADAHAWPELLIGGRWLPFEPTPIRPLPDRAAEPQAQQPAPAPVLSPATVDEPWPPWALPLGALACLALAGASVALWRAALWPRSPLSRAQLQIERLGARAGVPWPAGATLHEYARLLEARAGGEGRALRELVLLIEGARYGRRPLSTGDTARLAAAQAELRRWLRPIK